MTDKIMTDKKALIARIDAKAGVFTDVSDKIWG
jgi:hypothetical protein